MCHHMTSKMAPQPCGDAVRCGFGHLKQWELQNCILFFDVVEVAVARWSRALGRGVFVFGEKFRKGFWGRRLVGDVGQHDFGNM